MEFPTTVRIVRKFVVTKFVVRKFGIRKIGIRKIFPLFFLFLNFHLLDSSIPYLYAQAASGVRLLGTEQSSAGTLEIYELAHSLNHPWSVAWTQNDALVLSERNGSVWLLWQQRLYQVQQLPQDVLQRGQGGYLGLYSHSGRIYLSYSKKSGTQSTQSTLALVSFRLESARGQFSATDLRLEFEALPYLSGNLHYGGTITADRDSLYLSVGDRRLRNQAQNPKSHWGKIIRLTTKKSPPEASIFSSGHRNPQGLFYDARRKQLWSTEHGPQGGDELNAIEPGKNYGWPIITYGVEYRSAAKIGEGTHKGGLEQPLHYWIPSPAPGGLAIVQSQAQSGQIDSPFSQWAGDFLIPMLKAQKLIHLQLKGAAQKNPIAEELFVRRFGRLRWVGQGPDGNIYLLTDDSNGRLLRIVPTTK